MVQGWGKMEISLGFVTNPEDFYLKYTMHFSAEAESHLNFQKVVKKKLAGKIKFSRKEEFLFVLLLVF